MPEMDGITCLRTMRAMQLAPRPSVVMCTTESGLSKIREALEAGADEFIMKPYDRDVLLDKLEQLGLIESGMTMLHAQPTARASRVMVVDDSAIVRGLISRMLESRYAHRGRRVLQQWPDGGGAGRRASRGCHHPGYRDAGHGRADRAAASCWQAAPHVRVIMASTLTQRNAASA